MTGLLQDVRYALRQLRKSPWFAGVAILSLALGIGANTAIFSALNAVLLRSLPVRNAHELRLVNWVARSATLNSYTGFDSGMAPNGMQGGGSFPYPAYLEFRDKSVGFADVFAFFPIKSVTAVAQGEASTSNAMLVSGNYFSGYGATTLIGRPIAPQDDQPGATPVAVITYRWWEKHLGLDPAVLGKSIALNRGTYSVIGVLPRDYVGPMLGDPTDIYVPMSAQPQLSSSRDLNSPNRWWVQIMGRLAPGASEAQAQASLAVLFNQVLGQSNTKMEQPGILLEDGSRGHLALRQRLAKPIVALLIVVALVLLIACTNVAGLMLARGAARHHEMALRTAIGASRWRLIRQSLMESLILSIAGACIGLVVAAGIKQALLDFFSFLPDGFSFDLRMDPKVLVFTLCVAVVTALFFGLLPGLRASRVDPLAGINGQSTAGTPRLQMGKALVALQVGVSVLLVFATGLTIRTFINVQRHNPGFNPENVLIFRIDPGQAGYSGQKLTSFYDQTRSAIAAIPGVRSVAFSSFALASESFSSEGIEFPGRVKKSGEESNTAVLTVSDDFFRTMSIPLLIGREFTAADTETAQPVAVVNEAFVRKFLPGEHPIGREVLLQDGTGRGLQIVGVSRDAAYSDAYTEVPPILYSSQRQRADGRVSFEVRSVLPPLSLVPAVRKTLATIDPNLPLSGIKTQEQQLDQSMAPHRLFASLGGAVAGLALLLSCIGLNGLMAYHVARRTREIGVRIALGATPQRVGRAVIREALLLALIGLSFGLPAALALAHIARSQLFGVTATDPITLLGTGMLLIAVTVLAGWVPARRATKIDPMVALRYE